LYLSVFDSPVTSIEKVLAVELSELVTVRVTQLSPPGVIDNSL
jgi:hypothetical protein